MSFEVTVSENGKYILCRVTGQITVEIAREFSIEMDRFSRMHGIKRFLNDARGALNVANVFQNYNFANKDMTELELQRDARAAILVRADDTSHDFVETVLRNAGFNVKVFRDEAEAIAWLSE